MWRIEKRFDGFDAYYCDRCIVSGVSWPEAATVLLEKMKHDIELYSKLLEDYDDIMIPAYRIFTKMFTKVTLPSEESIEVFRLLNKLKELSGV